MYLTQKEKKIMIDFIKSELKHLKRYRELYETSTEIAVRSKIQMIVFDLKQQAISSREFVKDQRSFFARHADILAEMDAYIQLCELK